MEEHLDRWAARQELPDGGEAEARGRLVGFQSVIDVECASIMQAFYPADQVDPEGRLIPQTETKENNA